MNRYPTVALATLMALAVPATAQAQGQQSPAQRMAAQREGMAALAALDGVWRGPASTILPNGSKHEITQTERVGPFLDGSIKVVEGRGYEADGKVSFNAMGTISYDPATRGYKMHSHAQGHVGDFVLVPTADGFTWEVPAGPMTIRYTAVVKDGTWREVGDRIMPGKEPARFFEMNLKRIGDTTWPAGDAVSHK